MAVSKLEQGDAINALIDIEAILARDDRYWPAYYHIGRTQVQLGDDLEAKASFLRAAELNPGDAELHYLIATVGWQLADFGAAWTHGIAAIQAGYDRRGVEQLFKELRHYSDEPTCRVSSQPWKSIASSPLVPSSVFCRVESCAAVCSSSMHAISSTDS